MDKKFSLVAFFIVNFNFVFSLQITIYELTCAGIAGTENDGIVPKVLCLLLFKCKLQLPCFATSLL